MQQPPDGYCSDDYVCDSSDEETKPLDRVWLEYVHGGPCLTVICQAYLEDMRSVRKEQDAAFLESLEVDRAKVIIFHKSSYMVQ